MIVLTKINKAPIAVNSDHIQYIEETPDTIITMENNEKVVVTENLSDVIQKIVSYRRLINNLVVSEYDRQNRNSQ
jgi:flagellar protein FlbD